MKSILTIAALSVALSVPAVAQNSVGGAKPADAPMAQPGATGQTTAPAKPADTNSAVKKDEVKKDAKATAKSTDGKVDPEAAAPAGSAPTGAALPGTPGKTDGKGASIKTDTTKTTEKPAETKKQ